MHLSTTLGDRLRSREDDDGRDAFAGLTLAAVLGCEKRPPPGHVNRTLNDIIREEADGYKEIIDQSPHTKMTWKSFKELLRIRRTGSNWTSSTPIPSSDVPTTGSPLSRRQSTQVPIYTTDPPGPTETSGESPVPRENTLPVESTQDNTLRTLFSRHNSIRPLSRQFSQTDSSRLPTGFGPSDGPVMALRLSAALAEERELQRAESAAAAAVGGGGNSDEAEEDEEEEEAAEEEGLAGAPRMSLMALLEETDREVGTVGATYVFDDKDEEEGDRGGVEMEYNCCVCMVRHKGAAFIPCGHTFCRLCSRELWVNRGSCPLCNTFILEILDIF